MQINAHRSTKMVGHPKLFDDRIMWLVEKHQVNLDVNPEAAEIANIARTYLEEAKDIINEWIVAQGDPFKTLLDHYVLLATMHDELLLKHPPALEKAKEEFRKCSTPPTSPSPAAKSGSTDEPRAS